MAINIDELRARPLDPEIDEEITRFEDARHRIPRGRPRRGPVPRQPAEPGHLRPASGRHQPDGAGEDPVRPGRARAARDARVDRRPYSRGWGHLTTRQNVQFHFVELRDTPEVLRLLASVGLTSREACGDTVRNVAGCHLAGACPYEVLDISPWAEAAYRWFIRNPLSQRLPRKFKINFSGCATDCGQAMFNDVGVIGVTRPRPDGTTEAGLPRVPRRRARREPAPGAGARGVHEPRGPARHHRGDAAHVRPLRQPRQQAAGPHEVAGRHDGHRRAARAHRQGAQVPARRRPPTRAACPRSWRTRATRRPAWAPRSSADGGVPIEFSGLDPYRKWELANVVRGRANGTVSAYAHCKLGDITTDQFRQLAAIQRDLGVEVRITNRQNFVLRGLTEEQLPALHARLVEADMHRPGAELVRDVVSCPGADTCNLAVTQSRGLAADIDRALDDAGLAEVGGVRINISGCTNSCGQHHISDIGFMGFERRAHGRSAPGYQMLLGGTVGQMEIQFGEKATKLPAKTASAGRRARRVALRRRAVGGRELPAVARPLGRRGRGRHDAQGPRRLPDARREPRLLRRLRRDRTLRLGSRRERVRDVTTTTPVDITPAPPAIEVPDLDELAEISRRFEHRPASAIVAWAYDRFGDDLVLAASFQDCVLIDIVYRTVPDVEVAFLDTQYHFAETLWYVEQVKARYGLNLNVIRPDRDPDDLWHNDPDACCRVRKVEPMRRALDGKAAWMSGLRRAESAARRRRAVRLLRREPRPGEGQPDRDVVRQRRRRLREGPRPAGAPAHRAGLRLHRLLALHPSRRRRRGRPRRTLGRSRQDRVRPPPLTT